MIHSIYEQSNTSASPSPFVSRNVITLSALLIGLLGGQLANSVPVNCLC